MTIPYKNTSIIYEIPLLSKSTKNSKKSQEWYPEMKTYNVKGIHFSKKKKEK